MKTWKSRPVLAVIGVLLLAFVGCSGDSPTEPPKPGTGNPIPPSDSVTITVTVSNVTPTSAVVTATIDGGNAADGTAVEFETSLGTFLETGTAFALRSTTGGRAFVTVLAAEGAKSTVVRVRAKQTIVDRQVNFLTDEIPTGSPVINSITPNSGSPAGGYTVSIIGRNFFEPVRVFFGTKEAVVASYRAETPAVPAEIKAVVPSIDLPLSTPSLPVNVTVVARAGSANEVSGSLTGGFQYLLEVQTPEIYAVLPSSGPNEGNTRITITGAGFQSPLVAYFGSGNTRVDLELVSVSYNQIIAMTPPASGLGSTFQNSSVPLTIHNIASNKTATLTNAFRYGPEMQITAVQPLFASALGGTRVTISGFGFDDPVSVILAGVPAQVLSVSGTQIVVMATAPLIRDCRPEGGGAGPVVVTKIEEPAPGNTVESDFDFTYLFNEPVITLVNPSPVLEGGALSVTVLDPGLGNVLFRFDETTVFPTPASATNASGETVFTLTIPTGLEFDTEACTTGGGTVGEANVATEFELLFRNVITGCESPLDGGVLVTPLDTTCVTAPSATVAPTAIAFPNTVAGVTSAPVQVTITNTGSVPVTVSAPTVSNPVFGLSALTGTNPMPAGGQITFNVTFTPAAAGAQQGTITIPITGGSLTVTLTGNGI